MGCLAVERVRISRGRMRVDVRVSEGAPLRTSAELAARVLAVRPELELHSCINAKGPAFGDVIADTTLPHLLEHLIIAEQARLLDAAAPLAADADQGERSDRRERDMQGERDASHEARSTILVGTTELVADRCAVVEVSFTDDLVAVTALRNALAVLDDAAYLVSATNL